MIVCGTNYNSLKECLLRESELTLPKAISAAHATEELVDMPAKSLSQMRPSICTRFQDIQNIEAKSHLQLQR